MIGISRRQANILSGLRLCQLATRGEGVRLRDLSSIVGLAKSSVHSTLKILIEYGLVTRSSAHGQPLYAAAAAAAPDGTTLRFIPIRRDPDGEFRAAGL